MSELVIPEDQSNVPLDLRPDLTIFGIDEVDRGICEDSFENRKLLRSVKMTWTILWDSQGQPSGNIMAISAEMSAHRSTVTIEDRKSILANERDHNSDYLTGLDLILVTEVETMVPAWVLGATQTYRKMEDDPELLAKRKLASYPQRCAAIKSDRVRCMLWTSGRTTDEGLCKTHLGALLNRSGASIDRARARIAQAAAPAVDVLEFLMDSAISEPVRLKAATEILDRAGIRGGVEIESTVVLDVRPAATLIAERLAKLALGSTPAKLVEPDPEIVDAEIVD